MKPSAQFSWLLWLCKVRVIAISIIVAAAVATQSQRPEFHLHWFLLAIAAWYATAGLHFIVARTWPEARFPVYGQLFGDALLITAVVYTTGATDSSLLALYALLIILSAAGIERWVLYTLVAFCVAAFFGSVELAWRHLLPQPWVAEPSRGALATSIGLNVLAWLASAYVASLLSERLKEVRIQLEQQGDVLESLRALNDNIVRSMSGGLLTTDLEGKVYLVNESAERILEKTSAEMIGRHVSEVIDYPTSDPLPWRIELLVNAKGQEKVVGLTITELTTAGEAHVGFVYHFQDLTELRRLEREVQVRERMSALGRLAAGIAHEIRNPLASLSGSVKLLARNERRSAEERKILDIVLREAERLNRLVTDFLDYTRERQSKLEPIDLAPILEELAVLVRNNPRCGAEVQVLTDLGSEPLHVMGDADRLKQVFWNLCDNALKALAGKGRLQITARVLADRLRLEFSDNGCGLKPGTEHTIFEPFHSEFSDGTGLGLATAYSIIEQHKGRIWAESAVSGGAKFVIQLPDARGDVRAKDAAARAGSDAAQQAAAAAASAGGRAGTHKKR